MQNSYFLENFEKKIMFLQGKNCKIVLEAQEAEEGLRGRGGKS